MDPWGEGNGREYLERWPRDRVIFGSLYPYRLPPSPAFWLRSLVEQWEPQISPGSDPCNFKPPPSGGAFGPVALQSYPQS
jgi:hypothetical protein